MRRTLDSKEEYNLQQATNSQLDFILSQNSFNFEITTYSDKVNSIIQTIIDLKNTEMIITSDLNSKFTIRNRRDLSVIKTVEHLFGDLKCGICYPEQKLVLLGINRNLIKFDYE